MPLREINPTLPALKTWPGMMPASAAPGVMTPGQLGPMTRADFGTTDMTRSMSCTGMPSVMQMMSSMPASAASRIASAANGGGTKMTVASAPVLARASLTLSNTANRSTTCPPLPGVTPPTTSVPYARMRPA